MIARQIRPVVPGSFPGAASLAVQQAYAHPRKPVLAAAVRPVGIDLVARPYPRQLAELRARGLGLWDVYVSWRREGNLDGAIEDAALNDPASLRRRAPALQGVARNGGESARSMHSTAALGLPVTRLPPTSPANASRSLERKPGAWQAVFLTAGLL